jgi:hypothetical protein
MLVCAVVLACDPTANVFGVRILNDTTSAVTLKRCDTTDHDCSVFDNTKTLRSGDSVEVNASSGRSIIIWWRVFLQDGESPGCVRLQFDGEEDDAVRNVSQAEPCPS